jgi:hypothetical protein
VTQNARFFVEKLRHLARDNWSINNVNRLKLSKYFDHVFLTIVNLVPSRLLFFFRLVDFGVNHPYAMVTLVDSRNATGVAIKLCWHFSNMQELH